MRQHARDGALGMLGRACVLRMVDDRACPWGPEDFQPVNSPFWQAWAWASAFHSLNGQQLSLHIGAHIWRPKGARGGLAVSSTTPALMSGLAQMT